MMSKHKIMASTAAEVPCERQATTNALTSLFVDKNNCLVSVSSSCSSYLSEQSPILDYKYLLC